MTLVTSASSVDLRAFAGSFPSGVAVIATRGPDGNCHGITMNAVTSLSLDPPLYLVCLDQNSVTLGLILESGQFAVNVLAADQAEVSRIFASKRADKFATTPYTLGRLGCPVLDGVVAACECRLADVLPGGDHRIIVGRVVATHVFGGSPLVYHQGRYLDVPSAAPAVALPRPESGKRKRNGKAAPQANAAPGRAIKVAGKAVSKRRSDRARGRSELT